MQVKPVKQSTRVVSEAEWRPQCFCTFLEELESVTAACRASNHLALYRGHRESMWELHSTFVRSVLSNVFGILDGQKLPKDYRSSKEYNRVIGGLLLYKFGTYTQPSKELSELSNSVDPWFEWMKRIQQFPEEDIGPLKGSFLLDWTQDARVAVYFANDRRHMDREGAVWVYDASATGPVLHQDMRVEEILCMFQNAVRDDQAGGLPLIFCPSQQIACRRARNQDAVYVAQMDLRCDLAEIWNHYQEQRGSREPLVLKLVLPKGTTEECSRWLESEGMTPAFIYPIEHHRSIKQTPAPSAPA